MASLDLLLMGREGNGKSSTGNSILNTKAFNIRSGFSQTSGEVFKSSAVVEGRTVTIVDGFSLRDNSISGKQNVDATIGLAGKVVSMFANGFTAAIIVLKYGVRFTQQEKDAINIIRSIFGETFIRNYGVLVMTYGDSFEKDTEDERTTFEAWCSRQTGDVKELFRECGDRYVLFNNRAKDLGQMKEQVRQLLLKVGQVAKISSYTQNNFRNAKLGQKKLLVESRLPELQKQTSSFLEGITQSLRKLDDSFYTPADCIQVLQETKQKVDNFKHYLEQEDEGTNCIAQLKLQISVTEASINTKKERNERKLELESRIPRSTTPDYKNTDLANYVNPKVLAGFVFVCFILFYLYRKFF